MYLEPPGIRRVIIEPDVAPSNTYTTVDYLLCIPNANHPISQVYFRSTTPAVTDHPNVPWTDLSVHPSLGVVNGLTGGAFEAHGWEVVGGRTRPWVTESVVVNVRTISGGEFMPRRVWALVAGRTRYMGQTDAVGQGQYTVRPLVGQTFQLVADEALMSPRLRRGLDVQSGAFYLPPALSGYVYVADANGVVPDLAGIVWGSDPVSVGGVTFTPEPLYAPVLSGGLCSAWGGTVQTVTLDSSGGGGGPVIEGDPAYLDGVVEEVHPLLGIVRPLANSEVAVFERRGGQFVSMGGAFSNSVGEFRVEADVYGGGDVFAFSADFPGVIWAPGIPLNLGDRLRPTVNNGYVYEIVVAGVSGATEPDWWADQGDGTEGNIGTARATARPYYQPVGHGPLKMTLVTP
ncbi:hypothetical protein D9M69_424430 [compost metagenome]